MNLFNTFIARFRVTFSLRGDERIHPERDWFLLLCCSLFFLFMSVIWNLFFFSKVVENQDASTSTSASTTSMIESLEIVHALFETREEEVARYRSEYHVIDPSR